MRQSVLVVMSVKGGRYRDYNPAASGKCLIGLIGRSKLHSFHLPTFNNHHHYLESCVPKPP